MSFSHILNVLFLSIIFHATEYFVWLVCTCPIWEADYDAVTNRTPLNKYPIQHVFWWQKHKKINIDRRDKGLLLINKIVNNLWSLISAYFFWGFNSDTCRMLIQRNKNMRISIMCTISMSNAKQWIPSCFFPIWRESRRCPPRTIFLSLYPSSTMASPLPLQGFFFCFCIWEGEYKCRKLLLKYQPDYRH